VKRRPYWDDDDAEPAAADRWRQSRQNEGREYAAKVKALLDYARSPEAEVERKKRDARRHARARARFSS
jgi:hypothetical protein